MSNFIVTTDKDTASQLIAAGFKVVSHKGDAYTFLNQPPKNFNFGHFDKKKFCFTNMLSI